MKNGGPAFPTTDACYDRMDPPGEGMSLRDYFAAHAPELKEEHWRDMKLPKPQAEAIWRYDYADAMLAERDKRDGDSRHE